MRTRRRTQPRQQHQTRCRRPIRKAARSSLARPTTCAAITAPRTCAAAYNSFANAATPCIFNRTWGFINGRGIWVDRGCRADFQIARPNWGGWDNGYNIYCASDNGGRNVCPTDTRGGVQLIRQRSDSPCDFGRTWGYDRRGIWVDRGCRADFQIGGGGNGGNLRGGGGWKPGPGTQVITCASNDVHRDDCPVATHGGVRLVRQRSDSDCVYNSTWGYDRRGIWVDRGCRADFEVGNLR